MSGVMYKLLLAKDSIKIKLNNLLLLSISKFYFQ
jgi:hypothetical protein